ncbi:hypothetical protein QN277_022969 [Acacia crassicarpa]|nr:hypothetical protein QN277_022969 [Acacia crassicarpa]
MLQPNFWSSRFGSSLCLTVDSIESRVLSRTTAFSSSLPNLHRLLRDSPNASFLSVKPIGAVVDGGNLIWGRKLRPTLYSPALWKDAPLRPCLAAASSSADGSDSVRGESGSG